MLNWSNFEKWVRMTFSSMLESFVAGLLCFLFLMLVFLFLSLLGLSVGVHLTVSSEILTGFLFIALMVQFFVYTTLIQNGLQDED